MSSAIDDIFAATKKSQPSPVSVGAEKLVQKKRKRSAMSAKIPKVKEAKTKEERKQFADSRGSGPRRKTDEGFTIYKEDELGITDSGGDTPLCPFDCNCCF